MNIFIYCNLDPLLLELEVQELKDKVKQLEDGQRLMMNWISRLECVVANIPPSMLHSSSTILPTTPSTIHAEPSAFYQTLPATTPSTIHAEPSTSTFSTTILPTTPSTIHAEPSTFSTTILPTTPVPSTLLPHPINTLPLNSSSTIHAEPSTFSTTILPTTPVPSTLLPHPINTLPLNSSSILPPTALSSMPPLPSAAIDKTNHIVELQTFIFLTP